MNKHKADLINRRKFIRRSSMGIALFNILPGCALSGGKKLSHNDKLNVVGVGIGGRGGAVIDEVAALGHNFVALCDVDEKYAAKNFAKFPDAKRFMDYRVMFDEMSKGIDAVIIGTPDHTHAVIAMEAMRRGKHVFCEKPLAHSIHEVRKLMAAAQKYKVVTQLGNQGHSSESIRRVCEWVWAGAIGHVHTIHAGTSAFPNVYCQIIEPVQVTVRYTMCRRDWIMISGWARPRSQDTRLSGCIGIGAVGCRSVVARLAIGFATLRTRPSGRWISARPPRFTLK